uniref:DAGKc domain-containing protein n=1 Tax=Globisporangium ultimum (strain ATCC 200006 / CBS 805.95 / DAOM BR144) TaxID=431595 RepID=K3WT42_GLOUD
MQSHLDANPSPRFDDGLGDSYATHYGALSDAAAQERGDDGVGTPPGPGGSFPSASYGSRFASSYGSNHVMASFASSSILSPRESDPVARLQESQTATDTKHAHFFGASTFPTSTGPFYTQQHSDEILTPKSPEPENSTSSSQVQHEFASGHEHQEQSAAAPSVPLSPGSRQQQLSPGSRHSQHSKLSTLSKGGTTYVTRKSLTRESARELAKTALSVRATSVGDVTFENPHESNLRESIRRVQAYSRREVPLDYEITAKVRYHRRVCEIRMDRDVISWYRGMRHKGSIDTDDLVGAEAPASRPGYFRVHFFRKGRGTGASALRRTHSYVDFASDDTQVIDTWVRTIQELVRWQARAPSLAEKRRIKIVVNPHSGKRRARKIWLETVKPFFDLAQFDYVIEETTYSGHGIDMGKSYSADDGFEALVFIGGDGTLCEFMNGLLSRPEHEWREIVVSTPISLISAGTQNAFGTGVGIPTIEAAVFCIIKRKIRPLDVITTAAAREPEKVHYSYCGVGWGVAGDIAAESERYRWLGTSRYAFLKVKRAALMPKKHTGRVRYVLTDPQPPLCKYDDIRDMGALDQFEVEEGNVYDQERGVSTNRKSWGGFGGGLRSPASRKRYPDAMWKEETGKYMVVGVVNAAPDGAFAHPSDGNLDLIISRKGNLWRSLQLGILYLFGKELRSPLITYVKVKAVMIDPDQQDDCMNMDGEVLANGPWKIEVIPSLFKALSEK